MLELTALALLGVVLVVVVMASVVVLKALLWLVLLPVRLVFALLMIPLMALKFLVAGVFSLVGAPMLGVLLVAGLVALAVFG